MREALALIQFARSDPMPPSSGMLATLPIIPVLTEFTDCMDRGRTPDEVLETLHLLASKYLAISVWARHGGGAFLHPSVPEGWWEEYVAMAKREQDRGS